MTRRVVAAFASGLLACVLVASVSGMAAPARIAFAACAAEPDPDVSNLFSVSPAPTNLTLQGTAPFQVTITLVDTTLLSTPLTMSFTWGDGSSTPVSIVSCGDDLYNVPPQQLAHTYNSPGQYPVQWHLNAQGIQPITSLAVVLTVAGAATQEPATPTPTSPSESTPAAPTPTAPAAGGTAAITPATQTTPEASRSPEASQTASPAPTTSATPTTRPTTTGAAQVAPTPTATSIPAAPASGSTSPPSAPTAAELPRIVLDVPDVTDISTDPAVATTNLVLAGVTVWVFFSSVLFNQTLSQNRAEVEGWARRLRPKRVTASWRPPAARWAGPAAMAAVLVGTGLVYGFLEPSFGFNRPSLLLFTSVVIGVGVVGLLFSALEAWIRRREPGVAPVIKPFPLVLVIGIACVLASRVLNLHPGVMYGFAASCVVVGATGVSRLDGRVQAATTAACIALSVLCWLLLGPLRALPDGWPSQLLQSVAVIVFVGGMEGLLINLIPLDVMDGAKIYRWSRLVWVSLVLVSAFLVWHVLLNTHRSSFDSLRPASSWSVVAGFVVYTAAAGLFWGYFAVRNRKARRGTPAPG